MLKPRQSTSPCRTRLPADSTPAIGLRNFSPAKMPREQSKISGNRPLVRRFQLIASYTRTNHVEEFSVPQCRRAACRSCIPTFRTTCDRESTCSGRSTRAAGLQALTRAAGAEADATSQDREAARADLRLEITRAYWAVDHRARLAGRRETGVGTNQRASRRRPESVGCRIGAAERCAVDRSAAGAAANAADRSGEHPRDDVCGIQTARRPRARHAIRARRCIETAARYRASPQQPRGACGSAALEGCRSTEARANRPERKALEFRIGAAAERVAAASAGSLPVLTAIGGYDFARPNPRIFPIQASVEAVVGSRRQRSLAVVRWRPHSRGDRRGACESRAIESRLRDFDSLIDVEIRQRAADLRSARASVEAARGRRPRPRRKRAACSRRDLEPASRRTPTC